LHVEAPAWWDIKRRWPLSVCPSVCVVPDPKERMEGYSKVKIGMKEVHDTVIPFRSQKAKGQGNQAA